MLDGFRKAPHDNFAAVEQRLLLFGRRPISEQEIQGFDGLILLLKDRHDLLQEGRSTLARIVGVWRRRIVPWYLF